MPGQLVEVVCDLEKLLSACMKCLIISLQLTLPLRVVAANNLASDVASGDDRMECVVVHASIWWCICQKSDVRAWLRREKQTDFWNFSRYSCA